jgi:CheY-like chemotaxis protein
VEAKKIVIVEDEQLLVNALAGKLQREGYEVFTASNGQEGLSVIEAHKPDVIILDLMMPVMDGKTMLKHLRDLPGFGEIPVIVLTNAGTADNMRETQRYANAKCFLIKTNIDMQGIISRVKSLV